MTLTLKFRPRKQSFRERQEIIDSLYRSAVAREDGLQQDQEEPAANPGTPSASATADQSDDLTRAFVRLSNLPTYPLEDRLNRYEAALWRQACQILFTLQCLDRRKPWVGVRFR